MGSAGEGCTPDNATTAAHAVNSAVWLSSCDVTVSSPLTPLAKGVDEGYKLSISAAARCSISAKTQWGAMHALETLTHLAGENCTPRPTPIRHSFPSPPRPPRSQSVWVCCVERCSCAPFP